MSANLDPSQASERVPDGFADGEGPSLASQPVPDPPTDGEDPSQASHPVPEPPTNGEDLLGLRIAAALIDLVLLLVLFVVLAAVVGGVVAGGGEVFVGLNGYDVLYVALALGYYLVLEATIGQTVGKLLVGLRVVREDGGRPNVSAVVKRTLLRVVDWLPALYLVGFLAMLATGARRQRLGDLAADTRIARAVPIRHRGLAATGLASVLVLVLGGFVVYVASYLEDEEVQTYHDNGVSFDYPSGWQEATRDTAAEAGSADELWEVAFGVGNASGVSVTAYRMNMPVTAENLDAAKAQTDEVVRALFEQNGGTVEAGPEEITVAGMPGLRFRANGTLAGTSVESTIVFIFDGPTEYNVNCEATAEWVEEVERGCDMVLRTFRVDSVETAPTIPSAAETSAPLSEDMLAAVILPNV